MGELLEKITLMNYLKRYGRFELANEEPIRRSQTYFSSAAAIIRVKVRKLSYFTKSSKINSILLQPAKQQRRSFIDELIVRNLLWD